MQAAVCVVTQNTRFANRKFSSDQVDHVVTTTELRLEEAWTSLLLPSQMATCVIVVSLVPLLL